MATPAALVAKMIKKHGQAATIYWDAAGIDVTTATNNLVTNVYIETSRTYQAFGTTNAQVKAMLPTTTRDLTGARLVVGTQSYQILSVDVFEGAFQKVIMSCL